MVNLVQVRAEWTGGGVVGPAVSTFYAVGAQPAAIRDEVQQFFELVAPNLPAAVSIVIEQTGEVLDSETGAWLSSWSDPRPMVLTGADPGAFAKGVGARAVWETDGRTNNRRVRGSTFVAPVGAGAFSNDGTLDLQFLGRLQAAVLSLSSGLEGTMVIWTRPKNGTGGKVSVVTAGRAVDRASWLVSRRT